MRFCFPSIVSVHGNQTHRSLVRWEPETILANRYILEFPRLVKLIVARDNQYTVTKETSKSRAMP